MLDYTLDRVDRAGARFTSVPDEPLWRVLPFAAAATLLALFAAQTWWSGDAADRLWAYGLLAMAAVAAAGGALAWRRPGPPAVLRFDNHSRTVWFEDARGTRVSAVPYADIGPFEAGQYSSTSNGTSYTTYTIGLTLPDGRRLRLCRDTEAVRDEQLARLRLDVPLR